MTFERITILAVLCTTSLLLVTSDEAGAADVVLRKKIAPVRSIVTLGDIADIQATNTTERQRLATTQLWVAPPVGEVRYVSAKQVRDVLVNRGIDVDALNFYGASRVAIGWQNPPGQADAEQHRPRTGTDANDRGTIGFRTRPSASAATGQQATQDALSDEERTRVVEQVRTAIHAYLDANGNHTDQREVEFKLSDRFIKRLREVDELTVSGGRSPWMGRQSLDIEWDSDRGALTLPLSVTVYDTTPVLVAKRRIARGQMLTAADVAVQPPPRHARLSSNRVPIESLEEALGKEAARTISEGDVVTEEMCLSPRMVERNEIVTLVSAGGGIVVRRRAKALSDARHGDVTEVELLESKDRIAARVVGPGQLAMLGSSPPPQTAARRP